MCVLSEGLASITQFCTSVLSSFYFEIVKDSLYADSKTSSRRTAIVYTLQQVSVFASTPSSIHLTRV